MQPVREHCNLESQFIACEIHDGFLQTAVAALMELETLRTRMDVAVAEKAAALLQASIAEARNLLAEIHSPTVDPGGLAPALLCFVADQEDQFGIPIDLSFEGLDIGTEPAVEQAAFRILQECLRNACRHSRTPQIQAQINRHPACLLLAVQDWGVGFLEAEIGSSRFGLKGIKRRAERLGGKVYVRSRPGHGTRISVILPCEAR